jgi:hypothetical protein
MAQKVINKALGLDTFHNELELPEGSLLIADDVIIDRDDIIESRRGFFLYSNDLGTSATKVKQVLEYKGRILAHYDTSLAFDNGSGVFTNFSGIYPELLDGLRIKGSELNGNFYFTTANGIKKISAKSASELSSDTGYILNAGAPKGLDIIAVVNYDNAGFLNADSVTAYRVLWGYRDANNVLVLGYPSALTIIRNIDTTETCTVDLQFVIPSECITNKNYFYQVYRSAQKSPSTQTPEDEMNLVIEDFPTDLDYSTGLVTINDPTPEDFRNGGAILYTNPISGSGILQANERPPIAQDIATFKNYTFYANTVTKHTAKLNLLSLDNFVSSQSRLIIGNKNTVNEYLFRGSAEEAYIDLTGLNLVKQVETVDFSTFSGTLPSDLDGKYFIKRAASDIRQYAFWFDGTGSTSVPADQIVLDSIQIKVDVHSQSTISQITSTLNSTLNTISDFSSSLVGSDSVKITNQLEGITTSISAGTLPGTITVSVNTVGNGIDGKYFFKNAASDLRKYIVYFDETGGSTSAPVGSASVGKIPIKVNIGAVSTADAVALNLKAALDQFVDFNTSFDGSSSTKLIIQNAANGNTTDINIGTMPSPITVGTNIQGIGEDYANQIVLLSSQPSNAQRIDESARSIIQAINRNPNSPITASYLSGINDLPGQILFENKDLTDTPFYMAVNEDIISNKFNPKLPTVKRTVPVAFNTPSAGFCQFTLNNHGYIPGDSLVIYNSLGISPVLYGVHTITSVTTNTFDIAYDAISGGTVDLFLGSVLSDNERSPNRLYYSKVSQPEAVPITNYFDVGSKDQDIVRIIALRDSLFIIKTDAIYRLSGTTSANFYISLLDASVRILAADSAAVLNNQIYLLSNQGIVTVTDSGVSVISRKIEDQILKYTSPSNYPNFGKIAFGLGYESDRTYLLWLPTNTEDTYATQCFRYNVFTQTWVRWVLPQTCAIINRVDNKLYLGCGDVNHIAKERKNFDRSDYADRSYDLSLVANSINGNIVQLSSLTNVVQYDVLEQLQYITISRYNRVLTKLDKDPTLLLTKIGDYADLTLDTGANMASAVVELYNKIIINDTIGTYTAPSGINTIEAIRDDFNRLMQELNASNGVFYADYLEYTDIVEYEAIITDINTKNSKVTLNIEIPLLEGDAKLFKAITSVVEWSPQTLGDSSLFKMFRQMYVMFDHFNFTFAELGVRSDISQDLQTTSFSGEGNGAFGTQIYGSKTYGGLGNQKQFRTWIPRNKMRAKFLFIRLIHHSGREQFSCVGHGITYNQTASDNQYK